jgi:hypothetical protein
MDDLSEAFLWVLKEVIALPHQCDNAKRDRDEGNGDHHTGCV